jgi:hypothetical protein
MKNNRRKEARIVIPGGSLLNIELADQDKRSVESTTETLIFLNSSPKIKEKQSKVIQISRSPQEKSFLRPYPKANSILLASSRDSTPPLPNLLPNSNSIPYKPPKAPLRQQIFTFMKKTSSEGRESISKLPAFASSRLTNPYYRAAHFNILRQKNKTRRKTGRERSLDLGLLHSKEFKFDALHEPKSFKLVHVPISTSVPHRSSISRMNSLEFLVNTSRIKRLENA